MSCEALVLVAHPDDAELTCGGAIKKLTNAGHRVVFVECTRGELGTRGTPELRELEAADAAQILGVHDRDYLGMPDGAIEHTQENILKVVSAIRAHRPRLLLTPPPIERHPDHEAVYKLARAACFLAGLHKIITERDGVQQTPYRPSKMLCFMQQYDLPRSPDVYVDVSDTFADKMKAIRAFKSQFHQPDAEASGDPQTFLSRPEFLEEVEARAIYFGSRIGVRYAEAFMGVEPIGLASLADVL